MEFAFHFCVRFSSLLMTQFTLILLFLRYKLLFILQTDSIRQLVPTSFLFNRFSLSHASACSINPSWSKVILCEERKASENLIRQIDSAILAGGDQEGTRWDVRTRFIAFECSFNIDRIDSRESSNEIKQGSERSRKASIKTFLITFASHTSTTRARERSELFIVVRVVNTTVWQLTRGGYRGSNWVESLKVVGNKPGEQILTLYTKVYVE